MDCSCSCSAVVVVVVVVVGGFVGVVCDFAVADAVASAASAFAAVDVAGIVAIAAVAFVWGDYEGENENGRDWGKDKQLS